MKLIPLPAFQDNYLWLLHDGRGALVVDPGDAKPVSEYIAAHGLHLAAILVTHHHPDHIGGGDEPREEGKSGQMLDSLGKLPALPGSTRVCCTHEYTLGNLRFAKALEPDNVELTRYLERCEQLRRGGEPTLRSSIGQEKRINPFLRTREPTVARAAQVYDGADPRDEVAISAAIPQWKNEFR